MSTKPSAHPTEQAHDAEYWRLLVVVSDASRQVEAAADRLISTAAVDDGPRAFGAHRKATSFDLAAERWPVGTLYAYEDPGFRHTFRVVTKRRDNGLRHVDSPASVKDALAVLPFDHKAVVAYAAALQIRNDALAAANAWDEAGYAPNPWQRFFVVTSSGGGHVHRDMNCSTCRLTTTFAPVVALSGCTVDEAIAWLGTALCSVCFPDAPVAGKIQKLSAAQVKKVLAGESVTEEASCPGSGTTYYDPATARIGYYSGNYGTCDHCGQRVTVPKTGRRMRKHAPKK